jgi:hypothetical protein
MVSEVAQRRLRSLEMVVVEFAAADPGMPVAAWAMGGIRASPNRTGPIPRSGVLTSLDERITGDTLGPWTP